MAVRNIDENEWKELKDRVRKLESGSPTGFTSITRGSLRVASPEGLIVEGSQRVSGTLRVTGTEIVDGTLRITGTLTVQGPTTLGGRTTISGDTTVSGRFDVDGPVTVDGNLNINGTTKITGDTTVSGPFHVDGDTDVDGRLQINGQTTLAGDTTVQGPFHVNGSTDINGSLDIDGNTRLNGNLNVQPGGAVRVDDMTIGRIAGTSQAGISFGVGQLKSTGDRTVLQSGDAIVGVRSNQVALLYGNLGIEVFSSGVYLEGVGFAPSGVSVYPVVTDSNGKLYRAPASN